MIMGFKERRFKTILIIKMSAIGDVVHTIPVLEVLRDNFRDARIDWVIEEDSADIVKGHNALDNLIISKRKSWQRRLKKGERGVIGEVRRFIRDLRSVEYDLVIDLQGLLKSGVVAGISRAKRKIGFTWGREGSTLFLSETPYYVDCNIHALDRYLQGLKYIGCEIDSWKGKIPVAQSDMEKIDQWAGKEGVDYSRLIAINPVAKWKTKLWDVRRFALLCDWIQDSLNFKVVFTGSPSDRDYIAHIINLTQNGAYNLSGLTTLKELAYLYSRCRALISTDTGPMHIASAMGCRVIAIFGPTAPWRTGPYGTGHRVLRSEISCSPCFKKRCGDMTCMRDISVDMVKDAVEEIL